MLYYLFDYLQETYNFPGAGVFQYISFRSAMAVITSLLVSMVFGGKLKKTKLDNRFHNLVWREKTKRKGLQQWED